MRSTYFEIKNRREIIAWALYDWGNSAFATVVIAGFFPVFLKQYWAADADVTVSSFRLGLANSIASLVVICLAPVLGAIADQGTFKKRFLISFAAVGVIATGALFFVSSGQWPWAVGLYILGGVGFASANIFYDALLVDVAPRRHLDVVSAWGFALGYLGGGLFLGFCAYLTLEPGTFGLAGRTEAVRLSFLLTAVWWAVFSIPLWRYVREHRTHAAVTLRDASMLGIRQLRDTFRSLRRYRQVILFLAAYWLYIDGVDTIVRMAVDYGAALGFTSQHLIFALLVTQLVGFPAAIAFGWIGQRLSAKTGILIGLAVYFGVTLWAYRLHQVWEFYAIAATIGLVQGGVQSLSRSLYARLIPPDSSAEFFGFYNLLGKFAAVIGPALMGGMAYFTQSTRLSILSLLVLFAGGAILLLFVNPNHDSTAGSAGQPPAPVSD